MKRALSLSIFVLLISGLDASPQQVSSASLMPKMSCAQLASLAFPDTTIAARRLFEKHRLGTPPLPTSMDLYRELQTVTPDQFQYLLQDLFERNTFWDLKTERATQQQTADGDWQVTLDVRARKVVVDEAGIEKEVPMDDLVPIGVFAARMPGEVFRKPLYLQQHRIRSGAQTITVTVSPKLREGGQPAEAGIDPDYLLPNSDGELPDNVAGVTIKR